ncbi:MAG: hypothetical protein ACK4IK_05250 [Bacteroidia bacterium]
MKKLILSLFALITMINVNAQKAQPNNGKKPLSQEERIERRLNKINEVSGGLTDAQKTRVKAILAEHDKQAEADRQKFAGDKEKMKEAAKNRRANSDARLKEVLSPDQYEKVMAHRKEMMQKRQQNKQGKANKEQKGKKESVPADDSNDELYD